MLFMPRKRQGIKTMIQVEKRSCHDLGHYNLHAEIFQKQLFRLYALILFLGIILLNLPPSPLRSLLNFICFDTEK